ncbi:MAG: uracil-DNA glycosylase [Thermoproteus sp. AZ2]|uniref:Uracil-DNA glycosylase n=1 Tax=Thermoproteus sp. AZ2 TaxID=1609232 RepID=A0ACC6V2D8_9CREN
MAGRGVPPPEFLEALINCAKCPRLVAYRESVPPLPRYAGQRYWRRPVQPWGDPEARLMVVGLAPAAHGGNRTGRMFTGDSSAQFLFKALHALGLASEPYSVSADDGVRLRCVYITSAVKCAPPDNKPTAEEAANCLPWLVEEIRLVRPRAVVALGSLAWRSVFRALGRPAPPFAHGARAEVGGVAVFASYHPSPRNTNPGRLTLEGLISVLREAAEAAGCG